MAGKALTSHDRFLLEQVSSGRSVSEIAEQTGYDPTDVYHRVNVLLSEHDLWTLEQKRTMLLITAQRFHGKMQQWLEQESRFDKDLANTYLKTLTTVGDILDRQSRHNKQNMEVITASATAFFMDVINKMMTHLQNKHPEITTQEMKEVLQIARRESGN